MSLFEEIGGERQVAEMLDVDDPQPYLLGIIAALTYHSPLAPSIFLLTL